MSVAALQTLSLKSWPLDILRAMTDPIIRLNAALEGHYRIERKLGEGGMASVYLARGQLGP